MNCTFALTLCIILLTNSPAVTFFSLRSRDTHCPKDWNQFMNMCWIKVPDALRSPSVNAAHNYCQQLHADIFLGDSVALCFTQGIEPDWEESYMSDIEAFEKRVMGNNGM